jgi:site-specific DNA-methyltransferase (adenine-specific)
MSAVIINADCRLALQTIESDSVECCITSPPYWGLRDYGVAGQLGLEATPEEYVSHLVEVFAQVRRVLRPDGTCWLNLGDSYTSGGRKERDPGQSKIHPAFEGNAFGDGLRPDTPSGLKPKDLVGIPWRVAFALQSDGWYLRSDIIWHKPNPMPESVTDRPTKAHEYVFLLAKSERYHYDADAIKEPFQTDPKENYPARARITGRGDQANGLGRNKRSIWTIPTRPYPEAHFATMPTALVEPCVLAGCPEGGTVIDPFAGAGTVGVVALRHGRNFIGIELNPEYCKMAEKRIASDMPLFNQEVKIV